MPRGLPFAVIEVLQGVLGLGLKNARAAPPDEIHQLEIDDRVTGFDLPSWAIEHAEAFPPLGLRIALMLAVSEGSALGQGASRTLRLRNGCPARRPADSLTNRCVDSRPFRGNTSAHWMCNATTTVLASMREPSQGRDSHAEWQVQRGK
jgi:hypothetical protein